MKLTLGNDQSERTQAASTGPGWPGCADQPDNRLLSGIRRPVGGPGSTPPPAGEYPSLGRRPAPGPRPDLRQRYLLRATHRLPVEGLGRDEHLLWLHGPSALSRMGHRWGVLTTVAGGSGTLRRVAGSGLELAEHGRRHDQIPPTPLSPKLTGVCIEFQAEARQWISRPGLSSGHGSGSSHTRLQSLPRCINRLSQPMPWRTRLTVRPGLLLLLR